MRTSYIGITATTLSVFAGGNTKLSDIKVNKTRCYGSKLRTKFMFSFLKSFVLGGICFFILSANIACAQTREQTAIKSKDKTVSQDVVLPGEDLQAVLDKGDDLLLKKGGVYEIKETLKFRFPYQKITTKDAEHISEYATLRIADPNLLQLIDSAQQNYVVLEKVILDGNRYSLGTVAKKVTTGGGGQPPMVFFGSHDTGDQKVINRVFGQKVVDCVFMSTRTWSSLQVREGAADCVVENNIFIGAGVDPRGNGRQKNEVPFAWGDAISCAAERSLVRNNLILDPTDVGLVFYGAPGSIAEDNVIAAISRESLGAMNLVDPIVYNLDEEKTRYDYRGVILRNNYVDAFGARIHIAFPMGPGIWVPAKKDKTLVGATVYGNTIAGGAAAYGFIADGVDGFNVYNNKSIANHSGIGEGLSATQPPDEPGPFIYEPQRIGNSKLQKEFIPCERHILHLLRCNHGQTNDLGYRIYTYGEYEVRAVINAAYLEMLGREPTQKEMEDNIVWLQKTQSTADQLRRKLLETEEFKSKFGEVASDDLHPYRIKLWMDIFDKIRRKYVKDEGSMPTAKEMYHEAIARLDRTEHKPVDASTLNKKVMCGYQGWYRAPGDGIGRSWVHWRDRNENFWPGRCGVDFWPDMSELDQDEKYKPNQFFHADGSPAYVFSSANEKTTLRHFKWMRDYGIDGVFVQRFVMEVTNKQDEPAILSRVGYNTVLEHCRKGANKYGRTYAIMYDLSGMPSNHIDKVINDFKYLVDIMKITRDPEDKAYQHHKGKPVVGVWGVGFNDRNYTLEEIEKFINFLKNDPKYGGNTVLLGMPIYWRSMDRDASKDIRWLDVYRKADIISPWMTGHTRDVNDVQIKIKSVITDDIKWCRENNLEYMPVVFPGFSWKNLTGKDSTIPRLGGQFLWAQYRELINAGATMIYQAMFDELDEGTQIYKVTDNPPVGESKFMTYEGQPSDYYLWLVGQGGRMLRGEIPQKFPEREQQISENQPKQ